MAAVVFRKLFLPDGFPESVSEDYWPYQKYDCLQALCSSVTGVLSTRAILAGAGVGDSAATATAATFSWILKDGLGMIGRLGFASYQGTNLDINCKTWRFMADILNDVGLGVDIACVFLPREWFIYLCALSSVLKSLCGVAGGATRAALTSHFSLRDNLADVSAKDGSQETAVNLIGSLIGGFILTFLSGYTEEDGHVAAAVLFAIFTAFHLVFNFLAVRAVYLRTINRQRLEILVDHLLQNRNRSRSGAGGGGGGGGGGFCIAKPYEVAQKEHILWFDWVDPSRCFHVGWSLPDIAKHAGISMSSIKSQLEFRMDALASGYAFVIASGNVYMVIGTGMSYDETTKVLVDGFIRGYCLLGSTRLDLKKDSDTVRGDAVASVLSVENMKAMGWGFSKVNVGDHGERVDFDQLLAPDLVKKLKAQ